MSNKASEQIGSVGDGGREVTIPWHGSDTPIVMRRFGSREEWIRAIGAFELTTNVPDAVRRKFTRALDLYRLAWTNLDIIKSAELAGFAALELALRNRFGKRSLAKQLELLVKNKGLTDADLPSVRSVQGSATDRLTGLSKPSLSEIRNRLAHGDPDDSGPIVGLMPLLRDLIDFAYEDTSSINNPFVRGGNLGRSDGR